MEAVILIVAAVAVLKWSKDQFHDKGPGHTYRETLDKGIRTQAYYNAYHIDQGNPSFHDMYRRRNNGFKPKDLNEVYQDYAQVIDKKKVLTEKIFRKGPVEIGIANRTQTMPLPWFGVPFIDKMKTSERRPLATNPTPVLVM